ncbi:hypothetical protein Q1695_012220 [Nippostrongylus brasiliensis]|nr:hypothetical protein Q1695_012220 [Nippostrongylus brasiliensis]
MFAVIILLSLCHLLQNARLTSKENYELKQRCGNTHLNLPNFKSFGGKHVRKNEFPWLTFLAFGGEECTGVLISAHHILSAAHCVVNDSEAVGTVEFCKESGFRNERKMAPLKGSEIVVGTSCTYPRKCGTKPLKPLKIQIHEGFNECSKENDLVIIELAKNVPRSTAIPICMPDKTTKLHKKLRSAGSGLVTPNEVDEDEETDGYQVVDIDFKETSQNWIVTSARHGVGICGGDSGGPLFQVDKGTSTLVGIMSFGNTCEDNFDDGSEDETDPESSTASRTESSAESESPDDEEDEEPLDNFIDVRKYLPWICKKTGVCPIENNNKKKKQEPREAAQQSPTQFEKNSAELEKNPRRLRKNSAEYRHTLCTISILVQVGRNVFLGSNNARQLENSPARVFR